MRVNVYAEELTSRCRVVYKRVEETGSTFYGVRFFLKTHDDLLPPVHPDDDSSAVTFWIKSGKHGFRLGDERPLAILLEGALAALRQIHLTDVGGVVDSPAEAVPLIDPRK